MKEKTLEQKTLLIAKKEKELESLAKKKLKPVVGRFLILMLIMVTLNFCVDIFGSNISNIMKSDALNNLLSGMEKEQSFQLAENLQLVFGIVVSAALPFYKSLTDRYGRKLFLILNTLITGAGLAIMMFATNIYVYCLGHVITSVGFQGDVHQIYILESAPTKLRARFASITKAISVLCSSLIGVFKLAFQSEAVPQSWRYVFIIPVAAALIVGILSCFLTQETEKFVDNRKLCLQQEIKVLKGEEIKKEEEKVKKLSFKEVITFIFAHKQTLFLFLAAFFFCGAMSFQKPYSLIIDESNNARAVAIVSIIYPFIEGAFSIIGGFISDKLGRKVNVIFNGILFIVAYAVFIIGSKFNLPVVVIGLMYGLVSGGYWSGRDTLGTTMSSESVPTQSRATIVGIFTLITGFASSITGAILSNIPALLHVDLSYTFLIGSAIIMGISLFFVITGVHETKDVDLEKVRGDEYDKKKTKK